MSLGAASSSHCRPPGWSGYPQISYPLRQRAGLSGLLLALLLIFCVGDPVAHLFGAEPHRQTFALPAGDAEKTLEKFSEQAGVQIVYLLGDVRGVMTHSVQGPYAIREALDLSVARTALRVEVEGKTGLFVIKRERPPQLVKKPLPEVTPTPNPPMKKSFPARLTAALAALTSSVLVAQNASDSATPPKEEVIVLAPFLFSATQDKGYRASNSVSGSRIDTPIKDLPFALQAFTTEFITDINPHDLFDVVRFSPGVTNRNGDFAAGNAGNFAIRGFATGSNPLRNGSAGPPIVDSVNIARVSPNASLSVDYEHFQKDELPLMMIPNIAFPVPKDWNSADYSDFRDSEFNNVVINAEVKIGDHWNARAAYAYIFRRVDFFTQGNFSLSNTATTNAGDIPATATLPVILQKNAMGRRPRELQHDGFQHTLTAEATGNYQRGGVFTRMLFGYQHDEIRSNSATW